MSRVKTVLPVVALFATLALSLQACGSSDEAASAAEDDDGGCVGTDCSKTPRKTTAPAYPSTAPPSNGGGYQPPRSTAPYDAGPYVYDAYRPTPAPPRDASISPLACNDLTQCCLRIGMANDRDKYVRTACLALGTLKSDSPKVCFAGYLMCQGYLAGLFGDVSFDASTVSCDGLRRCCDQMQQRGYDTVSCYNAAASRDQNYCANELQSRSYYCPGY